MKNTVCAIVAAMALLLGSALPAEAWGGYGGYHGYRGHRGHGGHHGYRGHHGYGGQRAYGVSRGFSGYHGYSTYGYGYPYRSYAFPRRDAREAPTVYVQQQFYWYSCEDANAYYPYVQQCPRGWSKVVPSPGTPAP